MLRKLVFSLLALGVVGVSLMAEEYRGRVKNVDPDKKTITIAVKGGGEKEFTIDKDTKFVTADGKDLKGGLKAKQFTNTEKLPAVVITTDSVDGKETVKEVKLSQRKKKN